MSRPRHYSQAAEAKRQQPDHFPDAGNMVDDDDEQLDWYDEDEYEEPAQGGAE